MSASESEQVLNEFHDLATAGRFCDRLILMTEGAALADGTPPEVLERDGGEEEPPFARQRPPEAGQTGPDLVGGEVLGQRGHEGQCCPTAPTADHWVSACSG